VRGEGENTPGFPDCTFEELWVRSFPHPISQLRLYSSASDMQTLCDFHGAEAVLRLRGGPRASQAAVEKTGFPLSDIEPREKAMDMVQHIFDRSAPFSRGHLYY
jgi:hypothetical protein